MEQPIYIIGSNLTIATIEALAEKYPFKISASSEGKKATIKISGAIWSWKNHAEWFQAEIDRYNKEGVNEISLTINTPGGDVFEASEIYNTIKAFNGKIIGDGGALVASAGTYIAKACDEFYMPQNGQWMYHKPIGSVRGNEDAIESHLKALKNMTSEYRKMYAETSKLTEKQIEKKWSKGDVWLNAEQALKDGFITGIRKEKAKVTESTTALFAACAAPEDHIPEKTTTKKKSKPENSIKMTDLQALAIRLGMDKDSTQAQVDAKLKELQANASKAEALEQEKEAAEKTAKQGKIKAMFDQAVKDKKLTAKQVEGLQKWAESDPEAVQAHIDTLPTLEAISKQINGNGTPSAAAAKLADKSFEAMTQEEQDELAENDPDAYKAKYEAYLNAEEKK